MSEADLSRDTDWDEVITAAVPLLSEFVSTQRMPAEHPVSTPVTGQVRSYTPQSLPLKGTEISEVLKDLRSALAERGYCNGAHPQYYGYFHPRPLPAAIVGSVVADLLNQSPAAWRMGVAATTIELETLAWLAEFTGYVTPAERPAGIFTSGGTTANLAALKLARDTILGRDVQETGLHKESQVSAVYVSTETHYSIPRAMDILGMGRVALRTVPTDATGGVSTRALRQLIRRDVADGITPVCVIGIAVSSGTGAVDDLDELADIAAEHHAWFHVDGAAGAVFANLPGATAFTGLRRADSLTLDPHKWLFLPYGLGCLLVRDSTELARSFHGEAHYWQHDDRPDPVFMGPEGSRPWRSLGLWLAMRQLGQRGYERILLANRDVARHLAGQVTKRHGFELLTDPVSPVCCFRVVPDDPTTDIDAFNERIQRALLETGQHYVTVIHPGGRTYLRASINNYLTRPHHVESLLDALDALRPLAA